MNYSIHMWETGIDGFNREVEIKPKMTKTRNEIGIDLGIKSFAVTSDEELIEAPKFFRETERKLAKLQRRLALQKKNGSSRRVETRLKVAWCHEKIADQRADFLHKHSRRLVNDIQSHLPRKIDRGGDGDKRPFGKINF